MSELDLILEQVRERYQPDADAKARVRSALYAGLAAGSITSSTTLAEGASDALAQGANGALGAGPAGAAGSLGGAGAAGGTGALGAAGKAFWSGALLKITASASVVVGLSIGAVQWAEPPRAPVAARAPSQPAEPVTAPAERAASPPQESPADVPAPSAPPVVDDTSVEPARRVKSRGGVVAPVAQGEPAPASTLLAELSLLREASKALRGGDAQRAGALLDEHERRFPASVLASERGGLSLLAKCTTQPTDATRSAARRFVEAAPESPLAAHVKERCLK